MTLLFLLRSLHPGGAERQLVALAKALAARGQRVVVAVFYTGGKLDAELVQAGVTLVDLRKGGRWSLVGFLWRLVRLIRRERPSVLHSYLVVPNLLSAALKLVFPRLPVVWGIRASHMDLGNFDRLAGLTFRMEGWLARLPDLIIYNSQAGRAWHEALGYPPHCAVVVPNGIDTDRYRPSPERGAALRAAWGVPASAKLVGLPARIDPQKGHETFIEAAALLKDAGLHFVAIGGGDEALQARLGEKAARLGLPMIWAGHCDDMEAAYSALDVACLPSVGEGFPNVIGEAMACGVPCVVTQVGDAPAIVAGSGLVVPVGDAPALAQALESLLAQGDGKAARDRIVTAYSVDALADNTLAALRPLVRP